MIVHLFYLFFIQIIYKTYKCGCSHVTQHQTYKSYFQETVNLMVKKIYTVFFLKNSFCFCFTSKHHTTLFFKANFCIIILNKRSKMRKISPLKVILEDILWQSCMFYIQKGCRPRILALLLVLFLLKFLFFVFKLELINFRWHTNKIEFWILYSIQFDTLDWLS